jgi:hypothetical protein
MASSLSNKDIDQSANQPKPMSVDTDSDEEDGLEPSFDNTEVKFVTSRTRPNVFGLMVKVNGKSVGVEDVPQQYVELARRSPKAALAKIKSDKELDGMSDDDLMGEIDKHFGINN